MNRSTSLARVLVDELVRGGVREVVLCPGSRNAPLSYALFDADRAGLLRLHVRIDERSAGFLALGLAKASGIPVPVVTTSGTAVANLHPAVLEASYSRVPLVVLSADRPPELVGSGANQTVVQAGLFGSAAAGFTVAGDEPARWRALVCRVLAAASGARTGSSGPVHVDVPFAEPLVPDDGTVAPGRDGGGPWTTVEPVVADAPVEIDLNVPTLVVAGSDAPAQPELAGVPTVAEPGFALRADVHPLAVAALAPQQVVVLGRPTLHRDVGRLLASGAPVTVLGAGPGWTDVAATAQRVGTRAVVSGQSPPSWLRECAAASDRARTQVAAALNAEGPTTGLHVARAVQQAVGPDDLVVLGSSNPVRDFSLVGSGDARVLANRGVAGIDGTVSTAIGAALTHAGATVALMGDLTFLHDTNGLLVGPDEPRPDLTIVVANDNGGGIFATLEQGAPERAVAFERVFGTPHGTDLAALCAAHGVGHELVDVASLASALAGPSGLRVLEVPTDRARLRDVHSRLRSSSTAAA